MTQAMTVRHGGLRKRQADLTRTVLFEALSELLTEGARDLTVQEVADRAGVSHRTVYRHFPSRDALFAAFTDWLEQRLADDGLLAPPRSVEELAKEVRREHEALDGFGPVLIAVMELGIAGEKRAERRATRNEAILRAISEVTSHLDPGRAEAVGWMIRCLTSSATWTFVRDEGGIDGRRSGEAVAWAIDTLIEALRRGDGPGAHEQGARTGEESGALRGRGSDGDEQAPADDDRSRRGRGR